MKNGIQNKNQLTFQVLRKLLLQLDALQELYQSAMEQIQIYLMFIQSNSNYELNMAQLYSSNHPQKLLETLQQQNKNNKNYENDQKYTQIDQKIQQIIFSLNKTTALQQQIKQYINSISELITKSKYKKESQMISISLSLILKKRQKFQLKILKKNNQLQENLNDLSNITMKNDSNLKRHYEFETIKKILNNQYEQKKIQQNNQESPITQVAINEHNYCYYNQNYQTQQQQQQYYYYQQLINYQMYQQYYYQQFNNDTQILNQPSYCYQTQPFVFNYYLQCQQNQQM